MTSLSANKIFDPCEMEEFRAAIAEHKDMEVVGARVFEFRYTGNLVYFKPRYGLVPCGWLEIKKIVTEKQDV